jgi:O-antigen/teichoic acid export membrane protein
MVLIPRHGAVGAAYTTCITQSILAVCYIVFSSRELQLPRNTKWIAAHAGFLFLLFAIAFAIKLMPVNWMVQLAAFGMISIAGMFVFRFISPEGLKLFTQKA